MQFGTPNCVPATSWTWTRWCSNWFCLVFLFEKLLSIIMKNGTCSFMTQALWCLKLCQSVCVCVCVCVSGHVLENLSCGLTLVRCPLLTRSSTCPSTFVCMQGCNLEWLWSFGSRRIATSGQCEGETGCNVAYWKLAERTCSSVSIFFALFEIFTSKSRCCLSLPILCSSMLSKPFSAGQQCLKEWLATISSLLVGRLELEQNFMWWHFVTVMQLHSFCIGDLLQKCRNICQTKVRGLLQYACVGAFEYMFASGGSFKKRKPIVEVCCCEMDGRAKTLMDREMVEASSFSLSFFLSLAMCLFICLSSYLASHVFFCLSIYFFFYLFICLSVCLSISPPIHLYIYLPVCLSDCQPVCMFACLFFFIYPSFFLVFRI